MPASAAPSRLVKPFGALSVLENVDVGALQDEPQHRRRHGARRWSSSNASVLPTKASLAAASLTLPDRKRLEVGARAGDASPSCCCSTR